ncbi:hypothetical protein Ae201684_011205 [Aphanomyces euteiches]|uniref:Uncharacterized protein n=1 Tax=Aphanomyces euteiches TaxID=100861 RepID=A0A6G0WVP5_9STRA|nr:hypothetical protein Ae201684_011205 [Aphanomyces euteiches]
MVKKRFTRVGVVLPDLPLYVRAPKEKSKSVEEIHQNLVLKQRKEVVDICSGLYLRLEHVKKALPKSLQKGNDAYVASILEKRINEEIEAQQEELMEENGRSEIFTPVDRMAIALEVCRDIFPQIGREVHEEAVAQANCEFIQVLLSLVDVIETCLHEKVARERNTRQHVIRGPEKVSKSPVAPSPRAKLQHFRRHYPQHDKSQCAKPASPPKPFELESLLLKEKIPALDDDITKVYKDNTFREVPKDEHITKEYSYCPVEARSDMASVRINVDETKKGKETWIVVEFPKARPSLTSEQVSQLSQWQALRFERLQAKVQQTKENDQVLRFYLEYTDAVMHEMCRLLFDKCPTSSNLLYGLWHFLFNIIAFINKSIEEELTVLQQTVRGLEVEVRQLEAKITKQASVLDAMRAKLTHKHKIISLTREKCIRQRNNLNRYLAADQMLIRVAINLIQSIHDLLPNKTILLSPTTPRYFTCTEALDEMTRTLAIKFKGTFSAPIPQQHHSHFAPENHDQIDVSTLSSAQMLTNFDIESMDPELEASRIRLTQLLSLSSPDCNTGWDAQSMWQLAFFIPTADEVKELEYRVRHMILRVERSIASRGIIRRRANKSTQTSNMVVATVPKNHVAQALRRVKLVAEFCRSPSVLNNLLPSNVEKIHLKHKGEMKALVPSAFHGRVHRIRADYISHDYTVSTTSRIISWLANQLVIQLASGINLHTDILRAPMPRDMMALTPSDAIYRVFLARFRVPMFANERLLDLVASLSHLDTQSDKIHLWCRLLHLAAVDPLPPMAFWFVLHALHVLAKCSPDGYFICEDEDDVEYVAQQPAWDALAIIFSSFSAEVFQRCKTKLVGLTQVYGATWIPVYSVIAMCIDEWEARYFAVKLELETRFANTLKVDSVATFHQVVAEFAPRANPYVIALAFASAVQKAKATHLESSECVTACLDAGLVPADAIGQFDKTALIFVTPSEAMQLKTLELSMILLKVVWSNTKDAISKALETQAHVDSTTGVRLMAPLDREIQEDPPHVTLSWHLLEQLITMAFAARPTSLPKI